MALAITPRGDFGYLLHLQGFKARFETAFWLEPVPIAIALLTRAGGPHPKKPLVYYTKKAM